MIKKRYINENIVNDLRQKMIFLGGPRQIGKTTLAEYIGNKAYKKFQYLNWDSREDKKIILNEAFESEAELLIFDELHKYKYWKNYIKGVYDKNKNKYHIIVSGSARLDVYRRGGDSLMGRYHYIRLHPFSIAEINDINLKVNVNKELKFSADKMKDFNTLLKYGGFPEAFLKKNDQTWRRFQNDRLERLVKEDIRDIESVRDLSQIEILAELLPTKVGSLFSINSLLEDLGVTHKTASLWIDILEKFYYHFRIYPFKSNKIKSLRKEPKLYLWDWSQIEDEAIRLENMAASHLLKFVHYLYDTEGYKAELYFLRDIEGREVDFLVTIDRKPWFMVEIKSSDKKISGNLKYYKEKLKIPYVYQAVNEHIDINKDGIRVINIAKFFSGLV